MNAHIAAGVFAGGEIEPGTFHVRVENDPRSGDPKDGSDTEPEAENAS